MSNSETKKKKALSGATMGMRFMQRKMGGRTAGGSPQRNNSIVAHNESTSSSAIDHETPTKNTMSYKGQDNSSGNRDEEEWIISNSNGSCVPRDNNQISNKMDIDEPNSNNNDIQNPLLQNDNEEEIIHLYEITTSPTDMYGISSDIIGRKSYNNYNKNVQETYNQALEARRKHKVDKKVEKEHISDEELLKRYEQYVRGQRSDLRNGGNGKEKVANDIGNFKGKLAKKRKR